MLRNSRTFILGNKPIRLRKKLWKRLALSFCHALKLKFSLEWNIGVKTNRMWFNVVCTLMDNDIRHNFGQNFLWTHEAHNILTTLMINIVVDKSTDNAEPHSIC